jgi:peptide/nickel transport system substrate-binding protein
LLAACAPAARPEGGASADQQPSQARFKRISASVKGDGHTLSERINNVGGATTIGIGSVEDAINAGLTHVDDHSVRQPQLAEAVPSIDNGLWRLLADGRMETTWHIRPSARWHDGTAFTAEDLVFTATVGADRDVGAFRDPAYDSIDTAEAIDGSTVLVHWKRPFIEADGMFTSDRGLPMPRHLLERGFLDDKTSFKNLPYWTDGYVGTGAYKVRDWVGGSYLVLDANDDYVLGRPRIDQIEIKFIVDANTMAANILAGAIDVTMGRGLSLEQGLSIREQWHDGLMDARSTGGIVMYPQFVDPDPAVVADVRFRRALVHAMDRQQMVDTFMSGFSSVAHSFLSPDFPDYKDIEPAIVRYEYDPVRAAQMIEDLGYRRDGQGAFRDASGRPLSVDLRVTAGDDLNQKVTFSITDFWQRVGVDAKPNVLPVQAANDQAFIAAFPGFTLTRFKNDLSRLRNFGTANTPLPENSFRVRGNTSRYMNPEFDTMVDSYFITIPPRERLGVVQQIVHHLTDQLVQISILYVTEPTMIANRLVNVAGAVQGSTETWNIHAWDLK